MSFAEEMRAALPEALHLPDAFAAALDWAEAQGQRAVFTNGDPSNFSAHYLSLYPLDEAFKPNTSIVSFNLEAGPPLHEPPAEVAARVASVARIAGDGGTLALWLDEDGAQQIVVFNHGYPHVLTDDPVTALRFLAIGYVEPGAIQDPDLTPEEHARMDGGDGPLCPPIAYRAFLKDHFNVDVPATATALGINVPEDGAPDPIRDWLDAAMPQPDPATLPGMSAENPYIITKSLRDMMGDEGIAILRECYPFIVEEE